MAGILSSFGAGLIFGLGLLISGLANPTKVLAFLDLFGQWDPSLALVMAGAVAVSALGHAVAKRRGTPFFASKLDLPTRRDLDPRLILGAAIFGLGWGLVGLCPGPALVISTVAPRQAGLFVTAMLAGMLLFRLLPERPSTITRNAREVDA
jgi:uncharacterized membrane protein YedE/YeeE